MSKFITGLTRVVAARDGVTAGLHAQFALKSGARLFRQGLVFGAVLYAICGTTPVLAQNRCAQPVARIVEAEGIISVGPAAGLISIAAGNQADVCAGDNIQAGTRSRAAVLLLGSNQTIRVNQNTTLTILSEMPAQRSIINLLRGFIRLINPIGRGLDVRTPYVTAGTEGTEFFVSFDADTQETTAGVIEGTVRVSTNSEAVRVTPGQVVRARQAGPLQRLNVQPADAVRWAIFYPPATWTLSPAEEMSLDPNVRAAWEAWRNSNLNGLATALNAIPPQPSAQGAALNAPSLLRFAALLLTVGQVDEASAAIDRAEMLYSRASLTPLIHRVAAGPAAASCRSLGPDWTLIPALRAIIAVARNETEGALALSECAVAAARDAGDPAATVAAAIARSYALQSAFRLAEAREALAAVASANDPLVLARLAELDLSLGDNGAARREAQRASEIAPSLSLTNSILGFSALANFDFSDAQTAFGKAASLDPGDPLPHLGLGLTAIRLGHLDAGRRELVLAVALGPENALARSYLGKTYAGLRMYPDAFREWSLAEAADPRDPTAPLYRAFAERDLNQPVAALEDIEKSIALNGNRAVYRSRLQLDQDLATRTTDLASVYRDLGFDQLALSQGYRSVNSDPANPGAHRFLSDSFLTMPRHETASDSELLQSLLLQPINVQPLRPRLAREGLSILDLQSPLRIGFNEFSPVFASNGFNVLVDALGGTLGTYGDNLVLSGIRQQFSFSLGQFYFNTDGIRPNDDFRRDIEDALFQVAVSDNVSVLAQVRHSNLDAGDTFLSFDPKRATLTGSSRQDLEQYRLGARVDIAEGLTVAGVWTHDRVGGPTNNGKGFVVDPTASAGFGEGAIYFSRPEFNVVAGGGYLDGDTNTVVTFNGRLIPQTATAITHGNGWIYTNETLFDIVQLTLGASYDQYRTPTIDEDAFNPKVGVSWEIISGSALRAAYFQTLKRTSFSGQTIEPTQIAGFNQLYDDVNGTKTRRWGVGFDQRVTDRLFAGVEWSQRQLHVPIRRGNQTIEQYQREDDGRGYLNWVLDDLFSINLALDWERLVRDPQGSNDLAIANQDLMRVPLELRYFDSIGTFGYLRATFVRETGHFLNVASKIFGGDTTFGVVDAGIGWRMPGQPLVGSLEVKNLFNTGFLFQDTDPINPTIVPKRIIMGRITWSF